MGRQTFLARKLSCFILTGNAGNSADSLKAGATFTGTVKGVAKGSISGSSLSPNGRGTDIVSPMVLALWMQSIQWR